MQEIKIIYAIIKLTEVAKVKQLVNKLDPEAFLIISDASEVVGKGFTTAVTPKEAQPKGSMKLPHTKTMIPPEY